MFSVQIQYEQTLYDINARLFCNEYCAKTRWAVFIFFKDCAVFTSCFDAQELHYPSKVGFQLQKLTAVCAP